MEEKKLSEDINTVEKEDGEKLKKYELNEGKV